MPKAKEDATIFKLPGILEDASFRKSQQDYKAVLAVQREHLKYLQPMQKKINYPFLAVLVPAGSLEQAVKLAERKDDLPQLPDTEEPTITGECTVHELADLLVMTARNVQLLEKKGIVVKLGRGRYDPVRSTQNYIRDLRELAQGGGDSALIEERKGLVRAQREKAEIELAVRKGQLVEAEPMQRAYERELTSIKNKLLSLWVKVDPELRTCRTKIQRKEVIERHVREILADLAGGVPLAGPDTGGRKKSAKPAAKPKRKPVGRRRKVSKPRK